MKHILFNKVNVVLLFLLMGNSSWAQVSKDAKVPGNVVAYSGVETGIYLGSPSIAVLPNGSYVASHDTFGPKSTEHIKAVSRIYRSTDKGKTWQQIAEVNGAFWSKLFVHQQVLYFIGTDRHHGNIIIRKSTDNGATWTAPTDENNGLLKQGEYHCAPMPFITHNGRLWRAMESAEGPEKVWGKRYGAFMMSIPLEVDLMKASNWTSSTILWRDSTYLNGNFNGWVEGNAVLDTNNKIVDVLRADDRSTFDEKAAIVNISDDGKTASFDPKKGFVNFPGGSKKFVIYYDKDTKRYITLANYITKDIKYSLNAQPKKIRSSRVRNVLALCSSKNLRDWEVNKIILQSNNVAKHGFQYVDWLFEGKDIIFLSRTAYEDGGKGANNCHDSNFITFHRIKKFRNLLSKPLIQKL